MRNGAKIYLIFIVACFAGCEGGDETLPPPKHNVLKEYINTPKEKAHAAVDASEERDRVVDDQAQELLNED